MNMNGLKFPYDPIIVEIQTRIYAATNTFGHIDFDSVPPFRVKKVTVQKIISATGNRTPVSRVTGGDTSHYTIADTPSGRKVLLYSS
jgi:hypothetical protein